MAEKIDCTLDDVNAALAYINVDDREEWRIAGMAIKSEFGEGGCSTWMDWSQGYKKFKQAEANSVWKSFKGRGITIGSLFGLALDRGFTFAQKEQTKEEKAAFAKACEDRRIAREAELLQEEADAQLWYAAVAKTANQLKTMLKPMGSSPYLGIKRVRGFGIYFAPHSFVIKTNDDFSIDIFSGGDSVNAFFKSKKETDSFVFFKKDSILIPLCDFAGTLQNFQIIFANGEKKRFLTNGRKSGYFHVIGEIPNAELPIVFCEGYATGASIHMATGWPVVVCFDAGNMPVVAEQFKDFLNVKICAGDNDWETALSPKKKNTGIVKAKEAAVVCGGTWCVPEFAGDAAGLSDFNDLHVAEGGPVVKAQLDRAVELIHAGNFCYEELPPVVEDIPVSAYEDYAPSDDVEVLSDDSPAPTITAAEITVEYYLRRYALTEPDAKVWDFDSHKLIKSGAFKNIIKPKIYTEWLNHPSRRTVALEDVEIDAAAAQKKGRGGLGEALRKYVYLNPSDTVWDKDRRELVPIAHLKIAIADCYAMWVTHPEREEIPARNFVFDPTQKVDVATHINQFRGLALSPVRDDKRCDRIVRMLMALCNNDMIVFRWLRRWLAYPLINVGAKMETAVLCHSDVHGSGKSYFFDVVMRAIYGENSRTVGQAQLEGQYNDWMSKVLYCVYEEVLSRSQKYSHVGTIKQTITGKTVRIEKKFMSGWEEANHMNSVFLSNEVLPLPVEPSDRRFLVIWPETKLYEELQRGVNEDLKNGGAAAFYQFLLDTRMQNDDEDYPFDEHTKPPMTEAKERLIEHGRAIWEVFYNEWERGALEHNGMSVPYGTLRVADLFRYFSAWCKINNEHTCGSKTFSSFIGSKIKKRKDLNFNYKTFIGKATFFVVGECPKGKTQEEWLGACVEGHCEILNKVEYLYGEKAA